MSFARAVTIAVILSTLLAVVAGCGGGGGSAGTGQGVSPGSVAGSINLKVAFTDAAPRLEVRGQDAVLAASTSTQKLVIDLLDGTGTPVMGTTSVQRGLDQSLTVIIQGIPFGHWKLQILAYDANGVLVGRFAQDVDIQPGVITTITATITPIVSPSPGFRRTFAYVADFNGQTITGNELNASRILTQITGSPFSVQLPSPHDLAVSPSRQFLFAALYGGTSPTPQGGHEAFSILADGRLTQASLQLAPNSTSLPMGLAAHPGLLRLYGSLSGDGSILAGKYDQITGVLTMGAPITASGTPGSVAIDPTGSHLYVANGINILIWDIDANGDLTNPRTYGLDVQINRLEMHPNGQFLFVSLENPAEIKSLSIASTGDLGPADSVTMSTGASPRGMAVSNDGAFLFAAANGTGTGWVQRIGVSAAGLLTDLGSANAGIHPQDVAVAPDGTVLVVSAGSTTTGPGDLRPFTLSGAGILTPTGQAVGTGNQPVTVVTVRK